MSRRVIRGLDATERATRRRELILDTALDMFARDGFSATSIEALCQTAYVGNKAFYEHFRSKEDCYLALLQHSTDTIFAGVLAALPGEGADEQTVTRALVGALARVLTDDPRIAIVTFGLSGGISARINRQRRDNRRRAADLVVETWRGFTEDLPEIAGPMSIAVVGGLFDLIGDELDRVDYRPEPDTCAVLSEHLAEFILAVRRGMGSGANPTVRA